MRATVSRRELLHIGCGTATALGISAFAGELIPVSAAQGGVGRGSSKDVRAVAIASGVGLFYREDWLGDPWRKPEPALLIHAIGESSTVWFGWVPRMATEFRVVRPDLPGFGLSKVPAAFEWSLVNLATMMAHMLDSAGAESAHIIGAEFGGCVAMQFAADYPRRARTLVVASAPVGRADSSGSNVEQRNGFGGGRSRLGSGASKGQVEYWNRMMAAASAEGRTGASKVLSALNLEEVLPRITVPTLVIASDRSKLQSLEAVTRYQQKIRNSKLQIIRSDAAHVAAINADECVTGVLAFINETRRSA